MDLKFKAMIDALHPSYEKLISMPPLSPCALPKGMPERGIYLFSEGKSNLYVGRTNRLKKRIGNHCRMGATHKMGAFAFKLAREKTGMLTASYRRDENSRDQLVLNPVFKNAFEEAKARIRNMGVRFVEEADPTTQALLEIYAAVTLDTRYNDFDTH